LREECRLRVFENRVLRRLFGPKRDEVLERKILRAIFGPTNEHGEWRIKYSNNELYAFYKESDIVT
jgi:hypothetical protein